MQTHEARSFQATLGSHYLALYRVGETNRCPGCRGEQWLVGRMMAERCQCGSALPLEQFSTYSATPRIERRDYQDHGLPEHLRPVA